MKNLTRNQKIAIWAGLALVTYLLFGASIVGFFSPSKKVSNNTNTTSTMNQSNSVNVEDLVIGNGDVAKRGDLLTVHYAGKLSDGRVFDSSIDRNLPFNFVLGAGDVIKGWDEGLVGMRVGGKRRLTIAPEYAYGSQGAGPIPPNSTLIFEVELLGVKSQS